MKPKDDPGVGALLDSKGRLSTPTKPPQWERPLRVDLSGGILAPFQSILHGDDEPFGVALTIWTSRLEPDFSPIDDLKFSPRIVRAPPDLLEQFLELADASDEEIRKFAEKYGGLQVFYKRQRTEFKEGHAAAIAWVHVEGSDVWRYFAVAMRAFLHIGASFYAGKDGAPEDWEVIIGTPLLTERTARQSDGDYDIFKGMGQTPEERWISMARFLRTRKESTHRNRRMFIRFVNVLVELGNVRPWVLWPASSGSRPQLLYSGQSLLSSLALQLCLRIARVDAFVLCTHCQKEYLPRKRAPKAGQRNFCPECRKQKIPKKYARQDFRERTRPRKNRG